MNGLSNQILVGDVRAVLATMPAGLFQSVVTSPPYWNLRSYLPKDHPDKALEIGSELTPELFVATMVDVFRGVRRVLRDDGTLWLNLGDSYNASPGQRKDTDTAGPKQKTNTASVQVGSRSVPTLKPGDLCNIPHRVAAALQADGWFWRSTIIWAKRSPMPESISGWRWVRCRVKLASKKPPTQTSKMNHANGTAQNRDCIGGEWQGGTEWTLCPGCPKCLPNDGYILRRGKWRPTTAHEYVFLFSKSERYFCDSEAVKEAASFASVKRMQAGYLGSDKERDANSHHGDGYQRGAGYHHEGRNPRSVWTLSSEPYKAAHFATFPTELARRCIEAGTSKAGCCPQCGACFAPVVESERVPTRPGTDTKCSTPIPRGWAVGSGSHDSIDNMTEEGGLRRAEEIGNRDPQRHVAVSRVTGYRPTCACAAAASPCQVLDPFGGSGTVGQVAKALGRAYTLIELNPGYAPLIEARINTPPRFKKVNGKPPRKPMDGQKTLVFAEHPLFAE